MAGDRGQVTGAVTASVLTAYHRQHDVPLVAFQEWLWPARFTEPLEEYHAVQTRVGLFDGSALGLLELTGRDRAAFLHGVVTNDVKGLPLNQACWACTLTPQGKIESLCLIVHRANAHWVVVPRWLVPRLYTFLERYHIMEDVQITDCSEAWAILALQGPRTPHVLQELAQAPVTCAAQRWSDIVWRGISLGILGHEPLGVPGALCMVPMEHAVSVWEACAQAGAEPAGLAALQMLRVEAGWPWYGVDADETCLLPETGWERTATSYTKGCYIGQEIVARIASQGQVARHLVGLKFSAPEPPAVPCEVLCEERACGTVTSAGYSPKYQTTIGLGMVARAAWTSSAGLSVRDQPNISAELIALPQLPLPV